MTVDAASLASELPRLLQRPLGPVVVSGVTRLKGGYSRQMWSFDTSPAGRSASGPRRTWILCADRTDGVVGPDSLDRPTEARLLHLANQHGIPAPDAIAWSAHGKSPLGAAWFVMERLPGSAAVGPLLRDPWYAEHRAELADRKAAILAAIHHLPTGDLLGHSPHPDEVADREVSRWIRALAETPEATTPTLERAAEWLATNRPPPPAKVTLIHGDYRTGNLLHDHEGIRGVLDWEMAHLGDPIEDVAWAQLIIWQLGTGLVGTLAQPAEWCRLYEHHAGRPVDPVALHFWEVLCSMKMSVLAWRAHSGTPAGAERDLLERLFRDLGDQLERTLLP